MSLVPREAGWCRGGSHGHYPHHHTERRTDPIPSSLVTKERAARTAAPPVFSLHSTINLNAILQNMDKISYVTVLQLYDSFTTHLTVNVLSTRNFTSFNQIYPISFTHSLNCSKRVQIRCKLRICHIERFRGNSWFRCKYSVCILWL